MITISQIGKFEWSKYFNNKIEFFQKFLNSYPIKKSLNKKPAKTEPKTKHANGIKIIISES